MKIREKENALFEEWIRERPRRNPFVKDGCSSPDVYLNSKHKVVFMLKEPNWGCTDKQQEENAVGERKGEDQRDIGYNGWFEPIGKWCSSISNPKLTWHKIEKTIKTNGLNKIIAPYAILQLKKSPGGGCSNPETLREILDDDKSFLLRQLSIYEPKFIISCGLWDVIRDKLFDGNYAVKKAPNGIEYFLVPDEYGDSKGVYVVNFCHPSMRCSKALNGAVAFALRDAIIFISQNQADFSSK